LPVLVDFWAAWCGPCRAVAPTVEALASEYAGKLKVVKLDVDESGDVAGQFGVQSIPTLILFKGGQPVERLIGNVPKPAIISKIQQHL
jgi:thioredoxin